MAHNEDLVRMDRAVAQVPERPSSIPDSFVKKDGAPDVAFQGHEFFLFATDHQEFTPSGVIGNPLRSSAEKGNRTYERYAEHLAAALAEFEKLEVEVHTREWRQIV
jgi:creatinine amidohydrolase